MKRKTGKKNCFEKLLLIEADAGESADYNRVGTFFVPAICIVS